MPCLFLLKRYLVKKHAGRPNTLTMQEAFDEICMSLETDSELFKV